MFFEKKSNWGKYPTELKAYLDLCAAYCLTLCILMKSSIWIQTMSLGRFIVHITGSRTWPVGAISDTSHCRSRGCEFNPGGDWSWNNFYGHSPPSADSRRVVGSYKRKYVHKVLVIRWVKLAQEKVWIGELTISTWP